MAAPKPPPVRRCRRCRAPVIRFTDPIGQTVTVEATPVSVLARLDDPLGVLWTYRGPHVGWDPYTPPRTWRPVHRVHTCPAPPARTPP